MAHFHPCINTLTEYSAGTLDWGLSICVAAHLELCTSCRAKVAELNMLGSLMIDSNLEAPLQSVITDGQEKQAFEQLMSKIRAKEKNHSTDVPLNAMSNAIDLNDKAKHLPKVVRKLLPKERLKWNFVSPSLKEAKLITGQNKYQVSFHRIKRGGKVPEHDHNGLEVTLVLEGCFSDENGKYSVGDYLVKQPGEKHRPMATLNEDCLCLSVVEAPVKITGVVGKLINPFLKINPA